MRRLTHVEVNPLFHDLHAVHVACIIYRLRCIAHRLIEFGFDDFVNTLDPRELVGLAVLMPQQQHDALLREAHARGDERIRAFIAAHCPHLIEEAVAHG